MTKEEQIALKIKEYKDWPENRASFTYRGVKVYFCKKCATITQAKGYADNRLKHFYGNKKGGHTKESRVKAIELGCICDGIQRPEWQKQLMNVKNKLNNKRRKRTWKRQ